MDTSSSCAPICQSISAASQMVIFSFLFLLLLAAPSCSPPFIFLLYLFFSTILSKHFHLKNYDHTITPCNYFALAQKRLTHLTSSVGSYGVFAAMLFLSRAIIPSRASRLPIRLLVPGPETRPMLLRSRTLRYLKINKDCSNDVLLGRPRKFHVFCCRLN